TRGRKAKACMHDPVSAIGERWRAIIDWPMYEPMTYTIRSRQPAAACASESANARRPPHGGAAGGARDSSGVVRSAPTSRERAGQVIAQLDQHFGADLRYTRRRQTKHLRDLLQRQL